MNDIYLLRKTAYNLKGLEAVFEQPPEKVKQDKIFENVQLNRRSISYLYE